MRCQGNFGPVRLLHVYLSFFPVCSTPPHSVYYFPLQCISFLSFQCILSSSVHLWQSLGFLLKYLAVFQASKPLLKIGILNNTNPLNTFPHQVHSSSDVLCINRGHSGYFLLYEHRHFSFLVEAIVLFLPFVLATLFTGKFRVEEMINCKNPFLTVMLILRVSNTFSFSDFF